jgi:hypothetical protein
MAGGFRNLATLTLTFVFATDELSQHALGLHAV